MMENEPHMKWDTRVRHKDTETESEGEALT